MLGFLYVLMVQAAAGAPREAPPAPTPIEQPAPSVAPAEVTVSRSEQEVVRCRAVRLTGSRLPEKRCSTARLDRETRDAANRLTRDMQYRSHNDMPLPKQD